VLRVGQQSQAVRIRDICAIPGVGEPATGAVGSARGLVEQMRNQLNGHACTVHEHVVREVPEDSEGLGTGGPDEARGVVGDDDRSTHEGRVPSDWRFTV
jgi:hypothetical protein